MDDHAPMQPITAALVDAMRDPNGQVREQAAMGLAITPGAEVIDPLLSALKDPDAQVREKAAIGLAFRRDPKIVEPLLIAIEDPTHKCARRRRSRSARAAIRAPWPH